MRSDRGGQPAARLSNVTKGYFSKPVLNCLTAEFPAGRVIGLLGENGVGKTTLLHLLAGLARADEGQVEILGQSVEKSSASQTSWLLEPDQFYPGFRVADALNWYQDFFPDFDREKAGRLAEGSGLLEKQKISLLSKGQKERLCLFLAVSRRVPLYLMDEPAAGFDPKFKREMVRILLENLEEGSTVILATHLLRDFGELFDTVAVLTGSGIYMEEADAIRERGMSVEDYYLEVIG